MTLGSNIQHIEHCAGAAEKDPRGMTLLDPCEARVIELERLPPDPGFLGRLDSMAMHLRNPGALA